MLSQSGYHPIPGKRQNIRANDAETCLLPPAKIVYRALIL